MKGKTPSRNVLRALALITQLGIGMLVPIVLCFFFGRWLDRMLGTSFFLIIFLIMGIMAAYRCLYYYTKPLWKGEKETENEKFWSERNEEHKK